MPRRRPGIATAAVVLLVLSLGSVSEATTWFVRQGGDDKADGRTAQAAFRSILRAAQVLNHGDDVVIGPGSYREAAFFAERFGTADDPVTITGDEAGRQTGDAPGPVVIEPARGDAPALHLFRLRSVALSGLTFRGGGGEGAVIGVGVGGRCAGGRARATWPV